MSGGAKLNGFLIWLDQGGALVFAIFGFHRIAARTILFNGQNESFQHAWLRAFAFLINFELLLIIRCLIVTISLQLS
jgi:hypothetical protein